MESVKAARETKEFAQVRVRGGTTTVKIFEPAPVKLERSASGRTQGRKPRYRVESLPFPRGSASMAYHQLWRGKFKGSLIYWAGQIDDPFATNALMDEIVGGLWAQTFPALASSWQKSDHREAITQVAGDALIDWRSSMGKEGIRVVLKAFEDENIMQEQVPEAAAWYLEDYRFIYANMEDEDNKGAFHSPLIAQAFAAHLKKTHDYTVVKNEEYGQPTGALGMAAAVVERALELIKSGKLYDTPTNAESSNGKKRRVPNYQPYADASWGEKTRGWAGSTKRLGEEKWKAVIEAASAFVEDGPDSREEEGGEGAQDPRSLI
ncbi:hypothetical protein BDZ97DRAFT_1844032, partial [Flammula alnicola]